MQVEYECAITGESAPGLEHVEENEELGDMPVGWSRITIERRELNPKWEMIQLMKQAQFKMLLDSLPAEQQDAQQWMISLQTEAQYAALEKATPQFLTYLESVFVSNTADAIGEMGNIRVILGLDDQGDESDLPYDEAIGDPEDDEESDD